MAQVVEWRLGMTSTVIAVKTPTANDNLVTSTDMEFDYAIAA